MTSANHMPPRLGAILADHDSGRTEFAMLECIASEFTCDESVRIEDTANLTDQQLIEAFGSLGWSVKPTLCPKHSGLPVTEEER